MRRAEMLRARKVIDADIAVVIQVQLWPSGGPTPRVRPGLALWFPMPCRHPAAMAARAACSVSITASDISRRNELPFSVGVQVFVPPDAGGSAKSNFTSTTCGRRQQPLGPELGEAGPDRGLGSPMDLAMASAVWGPAKERYKTQSRRVITRDATTSATRREVPLPSQFLCPVRRSGR